MTKWKPWKHDNDSVHAKPLYKTQIELNALKDNIEELLYISSNLALQLKIATDPLFEYPEQQSECAPCDALNNYYDFLNKYK